MIEYSDFNVLVLCSILTTSSDNLQKIPTLMSEFLVLIHKNLTCFLMSSVLHITQRILSVISVILSVEIEIINNETKNINTANISVMGKKEEREKEKWIDDHEN